MKLSILTVKVIAFLCFSLSFLSCSITTNLVKNGDPAYKRGVWHKVEEGQTLWRIAKTYRVSLEELKVANDIEDVVHIARGAWIFIPGAEKHLYVQGSVESAPQEQAKLEFTWPVRGEIIRSFGKYENDFNYGIDVRTSRNNGVRATQKGTVVLSNIVRGYGNTIIIEHENDFCSLYARNIKSIVKEGQSVDKNSIIARIDPEKSPDVAVVHYELFYKGKPVNPLYYLP
jgi:LysM repeat protein